MVIVAGGGGGQPDQPESARGDEKSIKTELKIAFKYPQSQVRRLIIIIVIIIRRSLYDVALVKYGAYRILAGG